MTKIEKVKQRLSAVAFLVVCFCFVFFKLYLFFGCVEKLSRFRQTALSAGRNGRVNAYLQTGTQVD